MSSYITGRRMPWAKSQATNGANGRGNPTRKRLNGLNGSRLSPMWLWSSGKVESAPYSQPNIALSAYKIPLAVCAAMRHDESSPKMPPRSSITVPSALRPHRTMPVHGANQLLRLVHSASNHQHNCSLEAAISLDRPRR